MRLRERVHKRADGVAKQRSPQSVGRSPATPPRQHAHPAGLIQRRPDPRALTPFNVLQLQRTVGNQAVRQFLTGAGTHGETAARREGNRTGLPDALKAGTERLSGLSLDDVRVHYNSDKPARFQAHAYTQGTEIHVAPGQERHLPHEAWHVVQQAQGRVRPTMQMKDGVPVNDDRGLEHEADVMGARVLQSKGEMHDATPDAVVVSNRNAVVMRAPAKDKDALQEQRPESLKNITIDTVDETKLIYDPFDQTLVVVLPDGKGVQITYVFEKKPAAAPGATKSGEAAGETQPDAEAGAPVARITNVVELSPMRVKALGFLDRKQGTFQETEKGPGLRKKADEARGQAKRKVWLEVPENRQAYDAYTKKLEDYTKSLAELPQGEKKPTPPPPPKTLPPDPATTLCNDFPLEMGGVVGPKGDSGLLANLDPADEGKKRGSWRTVETNPKGPKPGDVYSLGKVAYAKDGGIKRLGDIMHIGIFKSSRPGPNKKDIWTVVDGGQGTYASRQVILERTRLYDPTTHILSTNLADAGQDKDDRWLRGWIDIEKHFEKKDAAKQVVST
jgi:hypothetical protein